MNDLVIIENNVPLADSREVAERLSVKHRNFLEQIRKYEPQMEKRYGKVAFMAQPLSSGQTQIYALLTEPQCYLALTFSENTEEAINLRADLIDAFMEAKRQIAELKAQLELGPRRLAPSSLDLDFIRQKIAAGEEQKFLWNADAKNWRKLERRALRPLPEPKEEPVKALPAPKPQPTVEEAVMEVFKIKVPKGEKRSARKISQLGNTFLRRIGSPQVQTVLDMMFYQGRVSKEGEGRGALYGWIE
jgi:phage regulator Rha-like protein